MVVTQRHASLWACEYLYAYAHVSWSTRVCVVRHHHEGWRIKSHDWLFSFVHLPSILAEDLSVLLSPLDTVSTLVHGRRMQRVASDLGLPIVSATHCQGM